MSENIADEEKINLLEDKDEKKILQSIEDHEAIQVK